MIRGIIMLRQTYACKTAERENEPHQNIARAAASHSLTQQHCADELHLPADIRNIAITPRTQEVHT